MSGFVLRKLGQGLLTLFAVMSVLFILLRITVDPAVILAGADATPEMVEIVRERYDLDKSVIAQYGDFVIGLATLDFGPSYVYQLPAFAVIGDVLPASFRIILVSFVISIALAFVVGTIAALRDGRGDATAAMVTTYTAQSVPYFVVAYILILLFAIEWRLLPPSGGQGWAGVILPAASILVPQFATLSRIIRGQLLDALEQPHVIAARARGVPPRDVLFRHAYPAALPPILSWVGIQMGFSFGILVVIEPIFGYTGLGAVFVAAVGNGDLPVVQAAAMVIATIVILANMGMEIANRAIDPRLRAKAA